MGSRGIERSGAIATPGDKAFLLAGFATAIFSGFLLARWPFVVTGAVGLLLGIALLTAIARRRAVAATGILMLTLLGMLTDWLNPVLLGSLAGTVFTLKWLVFAVPAVVLIVNSRALALLLRPSSPAAKFFVAFLGWALLSLLLRGRSESALILKWVSVGVVYIVCFVVIPALAPRSGTIRPIIRTIGLFGVLVAGGSIVMLLTRPDETFVLGRFTGITSNAIAFGLVLTPTILALLTLAFGGTATARIPLLALAIGVIGLLVISGSRGSVISLVFGLAVVAVGLRRSRVAKQVGLLAIGLGVAVVVALQLFVRLDVDPQLGLLRGVGGSEQVRTELLRGSTKVLGADVRNPVFGIGIGVVRETYFARLGMAPSSSVTSEYAPYFRKFIHNSYLEILVETGVPGLMLILGALGAGVNAIRTVARSMSETDRIFHYGALAIVVAGLVDGVFNSLFLAPGSMFPLWFWGLIALHAQWSAAAKPLMERPELARAEP